MRGADAERLGMWVICSSIDGAPSSSFLCGGVLCSDSVKSESRMERPALFVGDAEEGAATLKESEVRLVSWRCECVWWLLLCLF